MELHKLKANLLEGKLPNKFLIFVCSENFFIADQYINMICDKSGKEKRSINSIFEQSSAMSLVFDFSEYINVLKTETFEEFSEDYTSLENTIVVCKKVDKKLLESASEFIVEIPKLEAWQIEDYIKQCCPELDDLEAKWLVQAADKNIYKIENELDKIRLFSGKNRNKVLAQLRFDSGSDLYSIDVFTLCDAIIYNNKGVLADFLKHQNNCSFELMSVVGALYTKAKNLLAVKYGNLSAVDLGISPGYYKRLVSEAWIPQGRLQMILQVASNIDLQLKSGLLDMPKNRQLDYLFSKLCD